MIWRATDAEREGEKSMCGALLHEGPRQLRDRIFVFALR